MGLRRILIACTVLAACLAVVDLVAIRALFAAVAQAIAWAADPLLGLIGLPVERAGTELRAADGAWAVVVTDVCDGHGLVAAWLALCAALAPGARRGLATALAGIAAIQLFNLVRVIALAVALSRGAGGFEVLHLEIFPLLTTGLMIVLAAGFAPGAARRVCIALAVGLGLSVIWFAGAARVADLVLVPTANAALWLAGSDLVRAIVSGGAEAHVLTNVLGRVDPPAFFRVPIYPADFLVPVPALVAAALVARRGALVLALALVAAAAALALGAVTGLWRGMETTAQALHMARLDAEGAIIGVVPAQVPGAGWRGLARLIQNVIVHANLLVLPPLILLTGRTRDAT